LEIKGQKIVATYATSGNVRVAFDKTLTGPILGFEHIEMIVPLPPWTGNVTAMVEEHL
jgi:ribosomal protein L35AE/L33A